MIDAELIFVCCPGELTTGGPELLHQLVDALRENGRNAFISYFPFDRKFTCPIAYRHYNAPQAPIEDRSSCLVVHPEVNTWNLQNIKRADVAIWWLSVDYFLGDRRNSRIKGAKLFLRMMLFKKYRHFVQSHYAEDFLRQYAIKSEFLTDYLSAAHLEPKQFASERQNLIAYNPKKGKSVIEFLSSGNPEIKFRPIENMTASEVADLLSVAKMYVDFGPHPGKDRLPREAAMAGCCVITGCRGAAAFRGDVPIPESYKLDETSSEFRARFSELVGDIFRNFNEHSQRFEAYRSAIRQEPVIFRQQVRSIFGVA